MKIDNENYFEIAEAIHCYASLNHNGLWSELYSILSQSQFKPSPLWSETRCLKENYYVNDLTDETCIDLFEQLKEFLNEIG